MKKLLALTIAVITILAVFTGCSKPVYEATGNVMEGMTAETVDGFSSTQNTIYNVMKDYRENKGWDGAQLVKGLNLYLPAMAEGDFEYNLVIVLTDRNPDDTSASILMMDLDDNKVYDIDGMVWPEDGDISTKAEGVTIMYSRMESMLHNNEDLETSIFWAEFETKNVLTDDEIGAINDILNK